MFPVEGIRIRRLGRIGNVLQAYAGPFVPGCDNDGIYLWIAKYRLELIFERFSSFFRSGARRIRHIVFHICGSNGYLLIVIRSLHASRLHELPIRTGLFFLQAPHVPDGHALIQLCDGIRIRYVPGRIYRIEYQGLAFEDEFQIRIFIEFGLKYGVYVSPRYYGCPYYHFWRSWNGIPNP